MIPGETGRRLVFWGRWAAGGTGLGYPCMSALMRIKAGGKSTAIAEANPDLIRTDQIIANAELRHRRVLVRQYCVQGSIREKALRMGLPKSTYWDLVEEAAWWVHTEYDKAPLVPYGQECNIVSSVGVLSSAHPQRRYSNGSG